jgi:hypothetical protein
MEARQEAIRIFFWNTFPATAPPQPTIPASPEARSRKPSPRENLLRERLRPSRGPRLRQIAPRVFVEAGSGALAAGDRPRAGDADGGIGISQKNSHGPLPHFHPSAVPEASTHAWSNPSPPSCPDTIPLHRIISPFESVMHGFQPDPR